MPGPRSEARRNQELVAEHRPPVADVRVHREPSRAWKENYCAHECGPLCDTSRYGSRQMSRIPVVEWSFEVPSGNAIMRSTTIGLFQCPLPQGSAVMRLPDDGWYTRSPPP